MKTIEKLVFLSLLFFSYTTAAIRPRIIGGFPAPAGEYPFAAAIYAKTPDSTFFCGGTLISEEWVLTSGHCVYGATSFTIQLGSNYIQGDDVNRVTVSANEWRVPDDFDTSLVANDIGLIKLRLPVSYTDYLRNVHFLPTYTLQNSAPTVAIGWGQINDETSGVENELRYVNLTTVPLSECQLYYGAQINENMVCVVGNYNEGTCIGDMGGSLLQHVGRGYYLNVGVASFISGNGCESTEPSGYTRTFSYMPWINNITGL